jgi:hypothetical protein
MTCDYTMQAKVICAKVLNVQLVAVVCTCSSSPLNCPILSESSPNSCSGLSAGIAAVPLNICFCVYSMSTCSMQTFRQCVNMVSVGKLMPQLQGTRHVYKCIRIEHTVCTSDTCDAWLLKHFMQSNMYSACIQHSVICTKSVELA